MKKLFFFIFLFLVCFLIKDNPTVESVDMGSYCHVPPGVGEVASPNVLLVIDVSGSMSWCAYNPTSSKSRCCDNSSGCGWTFNGTEEGYFIPNKVYRYKSSCSVGSYSGSCWEETTGTAKTCPKRPADINTSKKYTGACLNFIYMRRVDLLRWALTGGKPQSCDDNQIQKCDPEISSSQISCDSNACILYSESGQTVKVPLSRITGTDGGLLFQVKNYPLKPRFGVMFFSDDGVRYNKAYIGDFTGSANFDGINPYKNTITLVNYESPSGSTPIAPALWDAYNYFKQQSSQYGGFTPSSGSDNWKNPLYQCFDDNNDGNCQGNEIKPVPCAKNFIILLTDGQWNRGGSPVGRACSIDIGYENASADPVVPAYKLHKTGFTNPVDSRQSTFYVDSLYGIGLWLGGTGERSFKHVTIYGSFDRSKNWPDSLSDYPKTTCGPIDDCCSNSNCGKGSPCTNLPASSTDWDKNGDGVPDTFTSASDADQIKNALSNAMSSILSRASSGAAVATLASRTGISSLVIQPYYYPKYLTETGTEISWIGFLRSIWVDLKQNLREDTVANKILDMAESTWDKIIQFVTSDNETKIAVLKGDTDSGSNACTLDNFKDLNQIIPVFNSGCWLAKVDANSRTIKYNKNGVLADFKTSEASYLADMWKNIDSNIDSTKASCIIRYLSGEDLSNDSTCKNLDYVKRPRELNINSFCSINDKKTWKLGDIIHSTPSVVSDQPVNIYHIKYGDTDYLNNFIRKSDYKIRPTLVFVGANDGMLHAFRSGTIINQEDSNQPSKLQNAPNDTRTDLIGKEEWAFIPKNAIPYLIWYGKSDYCHVPTVDYRTFVVDAKVINKENKEEWKTLLVGSMGFGGKALGSYSSSVFVLDITDPLNPSLQWEKALPDQTLTLSFPAVTKIGSNWYVVIGSGPKDPDGTQFSTAKIYFFNLSNGDIVNTLTIKEQNSDVIAAVGDMMPVDVDLDYSDDAIYFGIYTTNSGDFYRITLKSGSGYKSVGSLTQNDIIKAVSVSSPVFAAPNFTLDEFGRLWVFFGTGRYLTQADKTISYNNYLIGFKDPCWNGSCSNTYSKNDLTDRTNTTVTATVTEFKKMCVCDPPNAPADKKMCPNPTDPDHQPCCKVDVVYDTTNGTSVPEPTNGWYYQLTGESIISQPIVFGGNVDALSFVPPADICAYGGSTNLLALYYKTGAPNPRPIVLSRLATSGTQGTITVYSKISLGSGAPPFGNPFQITQGISSREYTKFIQLSTGHVHRVEQQVSPGYGSRFISWIEK